GGGYLRVMTERLAYLAGIGVSCLWLMPLYPSAQRDDGYDVTDYFGVDPRLGSHGDVVEMVRTARDRGIRVIADLVPNHTSDQHPWFKAARRSREDPMRDWYVWRDAGVPDVPPNNWMAAFSADPAWTWDATTEQWYLHQFLAEQPDLNWD